MIEPDSQIYEFDDFRIDVIKRLLTDHDGKQIPLTPKVFDTLLYLIRHSGRVIGKDELMREIWIDSVVEENNLNQNISILRRVFGEKPGEQRFIVTVPGHGYRFVPEVRQPVSAESDEVLLRESSDIRPEVPYRLRRAHGFAAVGLLCLIGISAFAYYLWPRNVASEPVIKTLAVLPFKPLVAENRNEALELGMADALISKLSGVEEIVVRPLSSIRRFNSVDLDPVAAGRDLGVDSVLDGTIQNWGDRIRVSAKLIRITDGKQLWSDKFDERNTDLLAVQDAISEKAAAALRLRLSRKKRPTENTEAYQLYMKGRYQIAKGTPPDLIASIPFFEEAIKIDPGYALAYTGLANAYGVLGLAGDTTIPDAVSKAREAERKALEIDDTLGEAHIAHCLGTFWYDWDWQSADLECLRALEIDQGNSEFHGHYAMVLSNTGQHSEALSEAKRSRELNPVDLIQSALEGLYLLHAGRTDEALIQLRKTSELEPNFWMPHLWAASAYIEKGMYAEAVVESDKEKQITGGNLMPFGAYALARMGKSAEARVVLEELLKLSPTRRTPSYNIALIYNALDEHEKALEWLEKGYEHRDPNMTFIKVEPKWNNLRNEPRFMNLLERMNFPR